MNITMKARTENTLTLSWEPPKCGDRGGEMTSFNYQLINLNDTSEPIKGSTTSNVITLTDLEPMHMYEFEVAAETGVGRGPYSTSLAYNTLHATHLYRKIILYYNYLSKFYYTTKTIDIDIPHSALPLQYATCNH